MPGIDVNQLWTPARAVPSPQSDQKAPVTNVRGGRYGEQYVLPLIPTKHLLADEGSYFIATNPTPGTALAYNIQAAFSDTVPLFYVQNNDSKANPFGKRLYLDYIKLICTTAPASSTGVRFALKTDPAIRTISTNNTTAGAAVEGPVRLNNTQSGQTRINAGVSLLETRTARFLPARCQWRRSSP